MSRFMMRLLDQLISSDEPIERQNEKLRQLCHELMSKLETEVAHAGHRSARVEHSSSLEQDLRHHTVDLETALGQLKRTNHDLDAAKLKAETAKRDMFEAVEAINQGFGLFDAQNVLVINNSRFCQSFPDVKDHIQPGMHIDDFVSLISKSRYLDTGRAGGRDIWKTARLQRYTQPHITFNIGLAGDRWMKISQHQTPSLGTVILQTDVTDIMRLQKNERNKLVDNQAKFIRATLEHIDQGICIFDSKARLVGWNQRLVTLLNASEADFSLGQDFESLYVQINPQFEMGSDAWARRLRSWVLSNGSRPILNFEVKGRQQQILDILAREMPDSGFLISLTDVTAQRKSASTLARTNEVLEDRVANRTRELQNALEAAKRANASKSRFVAAASHDVLQPLSAAKLFLASIDKTTLPDQVDTVINKTQDALNSVEGILGALLELSRLEIDENALDVGYIDLGPIFQRMANEFAPSAAAKGLKFSLVPCQRVVRTDAEFLQRILRNLISNAIRYTEQGRILIGARRVGATLRIEVHDTGSGIALDEQRAIFREFYRSGIAASAAQGIGLGLAVVERACQRLDHPLGLRSEVGKGTMFHFTMPLSARASRAKLHLDAPNSGHPPQMGLVAMLVQSDDALRRAMSLFLEKCDVNVLAVASADEAERLLDELQIMPDAFLIDYQLDEKADGLAFTVRLRARFGDVPVCILSANRSTTLVEHCKAAGVSLLNKPIEPATLGEFLETVKPAQIGYGF